MSGKDDLLNGILPMVISGILDPKYITGKDPKKKDEKKEDPKQSDKDKPKGGGPHGRS